MEKKNQEKESPKNTITIPDERFHEWNGRYYPRCTFVLEQSYPLNSQLLNWFKEHGFESDRIKADAAKAGTRIHNAIEVLAKGGEVQFQNYTLDEWKKISSFVAWYREYKPKFLEIEKKVFNKKLKVIGTLDALALIDGKRYVIDWKSSRTMQERFFVQVAFYASCFETPPEHTAILRLGTTHKAGYGWHPRNYDEWKQDFHCFRACKMIFDDMNPTLAPKTMNYELSLKL